MTSELGDASPTVGTRRRIIDLIRRSSLSAPDIAARLDLTYNAVRAHLAALERDGLIRTAGQRRGATRPSTVYELAPGAEDELSRAYVPFAAQLVRSLARRLDEHDLGDLMRDVGRQLAAEFPRPRGKLDARVDAASMLLAELGAPNEIERTSEGLRIRGIGCLLAAAVQGQPHVCHAMETLLHELLEAPVRECCERGERPRCCFDIHAPTPTS